MKLRDTRLWAAIVALAFLVLWCVSVGVTYAAPVQEPLPEPVQTPVAAEIRAIGIGGWLLVGIGFLGVALAVAFGGNRPKKRQRTVRPSGTIRRTYKVMRSVYSPPPNHRYHRNVERRYR